MENESNRTTKEVGIYLINKNHRHFSHASMKYVINIQVRIPELDWDQRSFNPNQKKLRAYKQIQVFYLKIDISM